MKVIWTLAIVAATLLAVHGQDIAKQVCSANQNSAEYQVNSANVIIGTSLPMRNSGSGNLGCGEIYTATMQTFEAYRFAIKYINDNNYIPGIRFGLKAFDNCLSTTKALRNLQEMFPQTTSYQPYCTAKSTNLMLGVVGPYFSGTSIALATYAKKIPAVILSSVSASTALSDHIKYPTFFRTSTTLADQMRVIASVLDNLKWKKVLAIHTDNDYGSNGFEELVATSREFDICVSHGVKVPFHGSSNDYIRILSAVGSNDFVAGVIIGSNLVARNILQAVQQIPTLQKIQWILIDLDIDVPVSSVNLKQVRGAMVVLPKTTEVPAFRDYFVNLLKNPSVTDNPWFKEWYEKVYSCSLDSVGANRCVLQNENTLRNNFKQNPYVVPAIKAVFAYAKAFQNLCPSGIAVCQNALQSNPQALMDYFTSMDFTFPSNMILAGERIRFSVNGDTMEDQFTIYQYNNAGATGYTFKEIGSYQNRQLQMNTNPVFYDAIRNNVLTTPPVSLCGQEGCTDCILPPNHIKFQYTPGDIVIASLVDGHIYTPSPFTCGPFMGRRLASMVAVQWAVKAYKQQNPNKLQGVSLGSLVADVCPTGAVATGFLSDLFGTSNRLLDDKGIALSTRRNIYGFVDDTNNLLARYISPIIGQYKLPEIQVGATYDMIRSGVTSPYFIRAVPSEETYLKALVSLLRTRNWTYVQMVTSKTLPCNKLAQRFKAYAASHNICVSSTSYFDDGAATMYSELVSNSQAFVVVAFGPAEHIKELFDEIKKSGNRHLQIISGMAAWGTDPRYFDMATSDPEATITLGFKEKSNTQFENYLSSLRQSDIIANPFLTSLFEVTNKCSLVPNTRLSYSRVCSSLESFVPYQGNAPYVIRSIFSMADKLHEIIVEVCNDQNYNGLCPTFQGFDDIPQRLAEKLKNSAGIIDGEGTDDIVYYVVKNGFYVQFGNYNTKEEHLNINQFNSNMLDSQFNKMTNCPGVCLECQYLYTYKDMVYKPGDFIIAGSFSISESAPLPYQPYMCGDAKLSNGAQYTMAMMYALDQVNNNKAPVSVKGLTLGGFALDHCGTKGRQTLMVSDIYSGFLHQKFKMDESKILSWIIDGSGSSREAATLLNPLDIPLISPSATSEPLLNDFSNFFRTIQGDATVSRAMVKLAKELKFPYIQVVYSGDNYGRNAKDTLINMAKAEGICVTNAVEFSDHSQATDIVEELTRSDTPVVVFFMGTSDTEIMFEAITFDSTASSSLVVILPEPFNKVVRYYGSRMKYQPLAIKLQTSMPSEYQTYLESNPEDIFFTRYYMKLYRCNLKGYRVYRDECSYPLTPITKSGQFSTSNFALSTINAVYATVDALDRTIKDYCGRDYTSPCAAFMQAPDQRQRFITNLKEVSFINEAKQSFRFLQREGDVILNVLQYNKVSFDQIEVGSYAGVSLKMTDAFSDSYENVESKCSEPCLECINAGLAFSLTPGDIYLAGMFDVHKSSFDPFSCGRIKTLHGYLLLEAFHYAIDQVNAKKGQFENILSGVKLGGVGLDACSSQVRGGQLVANIHKNLTPLTKDGVTVKPSEIDVYIGSYESGSTRYLARILTDLEFPQISYAAASTDLSDQQLYPYFYRTVPSNVHQARAILSFLNKNNIRYTQVLYAGNSFGLSGRDELVKMAAEYKICIAQTVNYDDFGIASYQWSKAVLARLLKNPAANTVVTFLGTSYINSILEVVKKSPEAHYKLRFVGSDAWADNEEAIEGSERYAMDSVTLRLEADDVKAFESHMNSKTLAKSKIVPWFEEYFQEIHNCYTSPRNPYNLLRPCPQNPTSIINSIRYQQDPDVLNVINAVYASAFALDSTLKEFCGDGYTAVCRTYRDQVERRKTIRDKLADVEFVDPSDNHFKFNNRETQLNYRYSSIVAGPIGGTIYEKIGTYNTGMMTVNMTAAYQTSRPWNSDCNREDACTECPAIRDNTVRYATYSTNMNSDKYIVAFFDIHKQGVDPYRCGELNMPGFQQFLAFFYGVQTLFKNNGFSVLAVDTCSNPVRVDQDLFGLLQGTGICNSDFSLPNGKIIDADKITTVMATGDMNTLAVSRLLEPLKISYVSSNAMTDLLDDKDYLMRTIAPISARMRFLTLLLKLKGWTYMDAFYEESSFGYHSYKRFSYIAGMEGICVATPFAVGGGVSDRELDSFIDKLNTARGSRLIVLFGSTAFFSRVTAAASRAGVAENLVWILVAEFEIDQEAIRSIIPANNNLIIFTFHELTDEVKGFKRYVRMEYDLSLPDKNSKSIPREWFEEFFQEMNDCTLPQTVKPINTEKEPCDLNVFNNLFVSVNDFEPDSYVLNTVLATYAAIQGALAEQRSRENIKEKILETKIDELNENITDALSMSFGFTKEQWWEPGYVIRRWGMNNVADSFKDMIIKDLWTIVNLKLMKDLFTSACMETEAEGYCGCEYSSASAEKLSLEPNRPSEHRNYYKYGNDGDRDLEWPVWAVIVAILTGIGILITLILFLILLCAYPKKGGTSILGYMMIIGLIAIYAINFAFFVEATDTACGIRRFLMGVVYIICFAPLLIKAIDNWRFGHVDFAERQYSGISSPFALLMSAIAVVLIQCIIPIMWLILIHPTSTQRVYGIDDKQDDSWCDPVDDYDLGLVLSFSFVLFIVLITGIFSALSYGKETNNYESRWILFASITTAGCFLVWMIVTTNAKPFYRDPTVAIANFVNATLLMLAIPMRKMVLMMRSKRNKDKIPDINGGNMYDMYSDSYVNPGFELSDYNYDYAEKPSEF